MKPSRREFARLTGAALGAALIPTARADDKAAPKAKSSTGKPAAKAASKLPAPSQAEAEARVQAMVARWGSRLSPADRAELLRRSEEVQGALEAVRAFPLDDDDEPAVTFRAPRRRT